MKGIILAGGEGTRLRPVTFEVPKPLITIKKKPLINYNLDLLASTKVNDVKIIIRPQDEKDYERWHREYAKDFSGMTIDLVSEHEPMGTLGYIFHHLKDWMGDEDVFVVNGDVIHKNVDMNGMVAHHKASSMAATLVLMKVEKPDDYGTAIVDGSAITEFLEKKKGLPAGLVNAGVYIISSKALDQIASTAAAQGKYLMFEREMFPVLAGAKQLSGFISDGSFYDCGTFERWEKAIREV